MTKSSQLAWAFADFNTKSPTSESSFSTRQTGTTGHSSCSCDALLPVNTSVCIYENQRHNHCTIIKIWKSILMQSTIQSADLFSDFVNLPNNARFFFIKRKSWIIWCLHLSCFFSILQSGPVLSLCLSWRWYLEEYSPNIVQNVPQYGLLWCFHTTGLGLFIFGRNPTEVRRMVLIYPMTRYLNFDHLIEGVFAQFLCCKITIFSFVINKYVVGRYLETM